MASRPLCRDGGPPFHAKRVHVLMPFVERLATEDEKKRGVISPDLLHQNPAKLQRRYREEFGSHRKAA